MCLAQRDCGRLQYVIMGVLFARLGIRSSVFTFHCRGWRNRLERIVSRARSDGARGVVPGPYSTARRVLYGVAAGSKDVGDGVSVFVRLLKC